MKICVIWLGAPQKKIPILFVQQWNWVEESVTPSLIVSRGKKGKWGMNSLYSAFSKVGKKTCCIRWFFFLIYWQYFKRSGLNLCILIVFKGYCNTCIYSQCSDNFKAKYIFHLLNEIYNLHHSHEVFYELQILK